MEVNFFRIGMGTLDKRSTLKEITYRRDNSNAWRESGNWVASHWISEIWDTRPNCAWTRWGAITQMLMQKERWRNGRPPKWMATTYTTNYRKRWEWSHQDESTKWWRETLSEYERQPDSKGAYKTRDRSGGRSWFDGQVNKYPIPWTAWSPSMLSPMVQTEGETKVIIGLTDIYWENIAVSGKTVHECQSISHFYEDIGKQCLETSV